MPSWVKVSESLPPLDEAVWMYDESTGELLVGAMRLCDDGAYMWGNSCWEFRLSDSKGRWDGDFIFDDYYKPTHWMPLPQPPSKYPSADSVYP